jgi:hypothetical protein
MLFTFAGSSHQKYANYLLETVCNLELESGTELRDAILKSMLVSLSGKEGSFSAADFIQEYFNRLLEAIVEKKESSMVRISFEISFPVISTTLLVSSLIFAMV